MVSVSDKYTWSKKEENVSDLLRQKYSADVKKNKFIFVYIM